jgi:aspartate-semialdehyde dehydrogenase
MGYKVAVVGATGAVGQEMLNILAERGFPCDEVVALASTRSIGREVSFGDRRLTCHALQHHDFSKTDIALFSAAGAGAVVIDNSSHFRMDPDVPLVVPEVNSAAIADYRKKNIIANPNCSTAQLVVALKPLHDRAVIKRVVVATYQSTSGAGTAAMDELFNQTKGIYVNDRPTPAKFSKQIAFNVIPHIDTFMDDGFTRVDPTVEHGLALWVVSDNLRKGAALNAVQIAEILAGRYLRKAA